MWTPLGAWEGATGALSARGVVVPVFTGRTNQARDSAVPPSCLPIFLPLSSPFGPFVSPLAEAAPASHGPLTAHSRSLVQLPLLVSRSAAGLAVHFTPRKDNRHFPASPVLAALQQHTAKLLNHARPPPLPCLALARGRLPPRHRRRQRQPRRGPRPPRPRLIPQAPPRQPPGPRHWRECRRRGLRHWLRQCWRDGRRPRQRRREWRREGGGGGNGRDWGGCKRGC